MTQYNTLNVKLSHSQLDKLKSKIKNGTEVTLNVICNSNDETNFPHKSLLPNTQVLRFCKVKQSGGFLGRLQGPLLKASALLMKIVLKSLAKSV